MAQKVLTLSAGGIITEINDAYQGTVTSVAALTLGTTGTDLSSTVATGTTTPVITLHVPTASSSSRGALSASDWSEFNGKQAALGFTPINKAGDSSIGALSLIAGLSATTGDFSSGVNLGSSIFVSSVNPNTLNCGRSTAADNADIWLNYSGYNDAGAYYRNLQIGNGRNAAVISVVGSTKAVTFAGTVGFNGTTAIAKPTITGSRAGNAALASLLTALANYGLITDSTTA